MQQAYDQPKSVETVGSSTSTYFTHLGTSYREPNFPHILEPHIQYSNYIEPCIPHTMEPHSIMQRSSNFRYEGTKHWRDQEHSNDHKAQRSCQADLYESKAESSTNPGNWKMIRWSQGHQPYIRNRTLHLVDPSQCGNLVGNQ